MCGNPSVVRFGIVAVLIAASAAAATTPPVLVSLTPTAIVAGSLDFTLMVNGANFAAGAVVFVDGSPRTTQFIDNGQVRAALFAIDVATPRTLTITAQNANTPLSGPVTLQVVPNSPTISSLSPSIIAAGSGAFTLTITGSNFSSSAVVNVNGNANLRPTTFISLTQLTASLTAADASIVRTLNITVTNPINQTSPSAPLAVINPIPPAITILTPTSVVAGSSGFTLAITGANFLSTSQVKVNGAFHTTTFVDSSHLTAAIFSFEIASAGTLSVVVVNPNNLVSPAASLTVTPGNVPILQSITPSSVTAGSAAFTLAAAGSNFISTSVVRFNGGNRTTTFIDSKHLTATIQAVDVAVQGNDDITVFNFTTGATTGGTSGALSLAVVSKDAPVITSVSPATIATGSTSLKLTVNGSKFTITDTVSVNGSPRATEYVSASQLVVTLLPDDVASAGILSITDVTTSGLTSAPVTVNVADQTGAIVSFIDPSTVPVGSAPFTLAISGFNFVSQSVVLVDGAPRTTQFVSPTQLTTAITADDLSSPRQMAISVLNPNGTTSAAVNLAVTLVPPSISALSPTSVISGDAGQTLLIAGTGFTPSSVVALDGVTRTSALGANGNITVPLLAADIATPGFIAVTVTDVGGTSPAASLTIARPTILTVVLSTLSTASPTATVTVQGTAFLSSSKILFKGVAHDAAFNGAAGSLTTTFTASDLMDAGTFGIVVQNSPTSLSVPLLIAIVSPGDPRIDGILPGAILAGSSPTTLSVVGVNFVSGSFVRVNDNPKTTQFIGPNQLMAALNASDLATPGTLKVTVRNPDGAVSPAVNLIIYITPSGRRRAVSH